MSVLQLRAEVFIEKFSSTFISHILSEKVKASKSLISSKKNDV